MRYYFRRILHDMIVKFTICQVATEEDPAYLHYSCAEVYASVNDFFSRYYCFSPATYTTQHPLLSLLVGVVFE